MTRAISAFIGMSLSLAVHVVAQEAAGAVPPGGPRIDEICPASPQGGMPTQLIVLGQGFASDLQATIDGANASTSAPCSTIALVDAPPLQPGTHTLEITSGRDRATHSFEVISSVDSRSVVQSLLRSVERAFAGGCITQAGIAEGLSSRLRAIERDLGNNNLQAALGAVRGLEVSLASAAEVGKVDGRYSGAVSNTLLHYVTFPLLLQQAQQGGGGVRTITTKSEIKTPDGERLQTVETKTTISMIAPQGGGGTETASETETKVTDHKTGKTTTTKSKRKEKRHPIGGGGTRSVVTEDLNGDGTWDRESTSTTTPLAGGRTFTETVVKDLSTNKEITRSQSTADAPTTQGGATIFRTETLVDDGDGPDGKFDRKIVTIRTVSGNTTRIETQTFQLLPAEKLLSSSTTTQSGGAVIVGTTQFDDNGDGKIDRVSDFTTTTIG